MAACHVGAGAVSELCIGKPAVRPLPAAATVADAVAALKRSDGAVAAVVEGEEGKLELVRVCMADVLCYLCCDENLGSPAAALGRPVAGLAAAGAVRVVDRSSSVRDAVDALLDGAQSLAIPLADGHRKRPTSNEFCWLTTEDFVRFFLNSVAAFAPLPSLSIVDLGLVRTVALTVRPNDAAITAVPLVRAALATQTSVAVVSDDDRLIGELSPLTLAHRADIPLTAAAIIALSAIELMSFIDCFGSPPESTVKTIKAKLVEKDLLSMLTFLESDDLSPFTITSSSSSSSSPANSSSSSCSSSDDEVVTARRPRKGMMVTRYGSYSARMGRRSEEAIVCHPTSSLVAVMIQALAHRVSYVWVVDDEYVLIGIIGFSDVIRVLKEQLGG